MTRCCAVTTFYYQKLLIAAVVVVAVVKAATGSSEDDREDYLLDIPQGTLSGVVEQSLEERDIYLFWSIPYAKPPVGPLRFKDPEPADPWTGIRDASRVPPQCINMNDMAPGRDWKIYGQEDCLYLNIFTPKPTVTAGLPVMVYIHGGGFNTGHSQFFLPHVLLDEDVVLVVIQYRLGTLGFLSTEDSVLPGNYGLKDQTQALRWIQQNIGHFGGDPNLVTISGSSAGGASAHFQMLAPEAKGLFSKAILMSGTAFCPWSLETNHKEYAIKIAKNHSCPVDKGSEKILQCLREVSAESLVYAAQSFRTTMWNPIVMAPRVDGKYLPARPEVLMLRGKYNAVPIMSGVTAHEGGFSTQFLYEDENKLKHFLENFDEVAPDSFEFSKGDKHQVKLAHEIFNHFLGGVKVDFDNADDVTRMYGDAMFTIPHDLMLELHQAHGPVYAYEFKHRPKVSIGDFMGGGEYSKKWVNHCEEIIFLFKLDKLCPITTPEDQMMRQMLVKLFVNFMKTGNPTPDTDLGFTWRQCEGDRLPHLDLQIEPRMRDDRRQKRRAFWLSLPTARNIILDSRNVRHFHDDHLEPVMDGPFKDRAQEKKPTSPKISEHQGTKDEL